MLTALAVVVLLAVVAGGGALLLRWRDDRRRLEESHRRTAASLAEDAGRQSDLARIGAQTGPEFERFVARLLARDGCEDVRVSGGAGDRGADVTAIDPRGWRVVVQCKRYGPGRAVGDPELQRFLGTVFEEHHADTALFVTTGRFTKAAKELAGRRNVVLVDGDRLVDWVQQGPAGSPLPEDPLRDAV